jgi:hypothetical protein
MSSANSELGSKLNEMGSLSEALSEAVKSASSAQQKKPAASRSPGFTSKDLALSFENQQKVIEKHLNELKLAMIGQAASANDRLSSETLKWSEDSEKRLLEALNRLQLQLCMSGKL